MTANEREPDIQTGPNSVVVRAAVEAALAQERRFSRLETGQRETMSAIESMRDSFAKDMHDLHQVISNLAESSQSRDHEVLAEAQRASTKIIPLEKSLNDEFTWRTTFLAEYSEVVKRVSKMWEDAGNSTVVKKMWQGQAKFIWAAVGFFAFVVPSWAAFTHTIHLW